MISQPILLEGLVGKIDLIVENPWPFDATKPPVGIAWIGHPHPLFGGTRENKVVQTVSRALLALGYQTLRQNFRGVGKSEGQFDHGDGETADSLQVIQWAQTQHATNYPNHVAAPLVFAGFSFGSVVAARLYALLTQNVATNSTPVVEQVVLIGTAVTRWTVPQVPSTSLIIHGSTDDVIPLAPVAAWAAQWGLELHVIEDTGHFFHGKLNQLKNLIFAHWQRPDLKVVENHSPQTEE